MRSYRATDAALSHSRCEVIAGPLPGYRSRGPCPAPAGLPGASAQRGAGAELAGSTRWVESAGSDTAPLPPRTAPNYRRARSPYARYPGNGLERMMACARVKNTSLANATKTNTTQANTGEVKRSLRTHAGRRPDFEHPERGQSRRQSGRRWPTQFAVQHDQATDQTVWSTGVAAAMFLL